MIVDANLLIYAANVADPQHAPARSWLEKAFASDEQVGLPWPSLLAFVRIATHPRVGPHVVGTDTAWDIVENWLAQASAWVPVPTTRHAAILGGLVRRYHLTGNLIPDAHLAALAIEHGVTLCSADTDFARFSELRWVNPLCE